MECLAPTNVKSVEYIVGDVRKILWELLQNVESNAQPPDVVIIDPPRSGLSKKGVSRIAEFAPKRIVYISCNPATLARDGSQLIENGYSLRTVRPVDMFPQTYHIEGVALFVRD